MNNGKRVAMYLRVSTDGQTTENQRLELEQIAEHSGWRIVGTYEDHAISGAKGREKRPALDNLLKDANRRKFDLVAAWSVDRLGRSLQNLLEFLAEIQALGVDLYLHQQGIDTTTPAGKAMFQMCGVFAEFERSIMRDRINAGLARAHAQGKRLGRPPVAPEVEQRIRARLAEGVGVCKVAAMEGVGVSVVQRVKADALRGGVVGELPTTFDRNPLQPATNTLI